MTNKHLRTKIIKKLEQYDYSETEVAAKRIVNWFQGDFPVSEIENEIVSMKKDGRIIFQDRPHDDLHFEKNTIIKLNKPGKISNNINVNASSTNKQVASNNRKKSLPIVIIWIVAIATIIGTIFTILQFLF
jgi:hypothetical protein